MFCGIIIKLLSAYIYLALRRMLLKEIHLSLRYVYANIFKEVYLL